MSTSYFDGIVDFGTALYGAGTDPMDTVIMRDGVANGLLHAADSMGQVRVCYHPIAVASAKPVHDSYETIDGSPVAGQWYALGAQPFGAWPLTLRADGTPYKLRIRVGISASVNNQNTITLRFVLAPLGRQYEERDRAADHVYQVSATASAVTSATWTAGTSQGSAASATLLTLDADTARSWIGFASTFDGVSGAAPVQVEQCLVALYAFGRTSGTSLPRLHGLHLSEYIGL